MLDLERHHHRHHSRSERLSPSDMRSSPAGQTAAEDVRKTVPFVVRASMPADTAAIDTLFRASYATLLQADYQGDLLDAALPSMYKTSPRLIDSGTYFVAETGEGEIIAAGGWTQATPFGGVGPREIGHMRRLAVSPEHVRCGIGSVVLGEVLDNARLTGVQTLHCLSTLTARAFYRAHGFEEQGEVEMAVKPGLYLPAVQMSRSIL